MSIISRSIELNCGTIYLILESFNAIFVSKPGEILHKTCFQVLLKDLFGGAVGVAVDRCCCRSSSMTLLELLS